MVNSLGVFFNLFTYFFGLSLYLQASSTTNRMLESQSISELKAEITSLKGLLLSR